MKATLIFDLPDDHLEHKQAVKASDMAMALWDIKEYLRAQYKYHDDTRDDAEKTYEKFYEILNSHDINLDNL